MHVVITTQSIGGRRLKQGTPNQQYLLGQGKETAVCEVPTAQSIGGRRVKQGTPFLFPHIKLPETDWAWLLFGSARWRTLFSIGSRG